MSPFKNELTEDQYKMTEGERGLNQVVFLGVEKAESTHSERSALLAVPHKSGKSKSHDVSRLLLRQEQDDDAILR